LEEKFAELTAFIEAEDGTEYSELLRAKEREEENSSIREKENAELFKEIGIGKTPQAFKKAIDRARKRTEGTLSKIRDELIQVPDRRLEDRKVISQIQSISALGKACPQAAIYHANESKFGVGESDGTQKLVLGSQNVWCKAWGGGLWGAGEISINADFWFLHYPAAYCNLRIYPYVVLHGFYINIADDEWWNSAFSRTRVDVKIRTYQYYWSGWSNHTVHNLGDDNINRYGRIDRSGHYYHHMWVGASDPVWALVRVRLYAYARAAGSYAEVNFSDGAGNYVDVPHIHFFC
jgi:hypothetical protein